MVLFRKQTSTLFRKQSWMLFWKQTLTLFRKQSWTIFWSKKRYVILDIIKDAILDAKKDFFWDALSFVDDASHLASSLTTQCKKKLHLKGMLNGTLILGFVLVYTT